MFLRYCQTSAAFVFLISFGTSTVCAKEPSVSDQLRALTQSVDKLTSAQADLTRRLDSVSSSQMAILQQVQQLRSQVGEIKSAPAAAVKQAGPKYPVNLDIGAGRMEGDPNTTVVMVMYGDFQCSFCARFIEDTLPKLRSEFIETSQVRFALRDFTLMGHQDAPRASIAARCAEEQGKYWEMAHSLHGHQNDLTTGSIEQQAEHVGLDMEKYRQCTASGQHDKDADLDKTRAVYLAIQGTPSFAFGYMKPGSTMLTVTNMLYGNKPLEQYRTALSTVLSSPPPPAQ